MSDAAIHSALRELSRNELLWRNTAFVGVQYYYAESGVYAIRFRAGRDACDDWCISLVRARNPAEAAEKAMSMRRPDREELLKRLEAQRSALKSVQALLVGSIHSGTMDCHEALEVVEKALGDTPAQPPPA